MYTENDWRNYTELYHHGILGMKWGIRRYQNSDGSLTEEGRKRYGVKDSVDITKERPLASNKGHEDAVRKQIVNAVGECLSKQNGRGEIAKKLSNVCDEIKSNKRLSKSIKEMQALGKECQDFWDGKEYNYYSTLAGLVNYKFYKDSADEYGISKNDFIYGYKHEDFDQGTGNSYSLYLMDKGVDGSKYDQRCMKALSDYDDNLRAAVNDYMGDQATTRVRDVTSGKDVKASSVLVKAIDDQLNSYEYDADWFGGPVDECGFGDAATTKAYRKALEEAKADYERNKKVYDRI